MCPLELVPRFVAFKGTKGKRNFVGPLQKDAPTDQVLAWVCFRANVLSGTL